MTERQRQGQLRQLRHLSKSLEKFNNCVVGQVLKKTGGRVDPKLTNQLIDKKLGKQLQTSGNTKSGSLKDLAVWLALLSIFLDTRLAKNSTMVLEPLFIEGIERLTHYL
ncbi:MAG: hypothetical protein RMY64_03680 [Nostoc sp. DedQUE08]|nr:hypothetical protein [Nostoc sp. DedQUE08]MDZ8064729.1 hypothetical protein [Nostoc sp. DedQUE08]